MNDFILVHYNVDTLWDEGGKCEGLWELRNERKSGKKDDLQMLLETDDLLLRKAEFEDWQAMYRNVWSRPETARFMAWRLTTSEEDAKVRIWKTIKYQENHDTYLVYEKKSGQVIGFAGVEEMEPHIYQDAGIALGPEYVGKGYGKQILQLLLEYCSSLGGKEFYYSTRAKNAASKALALSCGFTYQYAEKKIDLRDGEPYELQVYHAVLSGNTGVGA